MIFSEQKMFADRQEINLANSTTEGVIELSNRIDLGEPQKPYGGKRELYRNIGGGDGIPIMACINYNNTALNAEYHVYLEASLGGRVAWYRVFKSFAKKTPGYIIRFKYMPDNATRFLRMFLTYKQTSAQASKKVIVTAAIGTYRPTPSSYL